MPTRRRALYGFALVAGGGGALTAGAFTSSVSAGADMRVVVVSHLRLEPARDDEAYVDKNDDGEIRIEFDLDEDDDTSGSGDGLNRNAYSEFGRLVRMINEGTVSYDEVVFSFTVSNGAGGDFDSEAEEAIVDALRIVSQHDVTENDDGEFTIEHDLGPGDDLVFGIGIDLLPSSDREMPDLSEGVDVELKITTEPEDDDP